MVMDAAVTTKICEKDSAREELGKQGNTELYVEFQKIKRSEEVMRNFSRALLSRLKHYRDKLKESENEVLYLKESLRKCAQAEVKEKELNVMKNPPSRRSNPPVEECAKGLSLSHGVSLSMIPSDTDNVQDTDAHPVENNTSLSPETAAKNEMERDTKTLDESLFDGKATGDKGDTLLPFHQRTPQQVDISAEAYSSLPLEGDTELSYQDLEKNAESFQKLTQSYVQVGEMDTVEMNLSDVASLTGPHGNAPVNIPLNECEFRGKTSNHSCFPPPTVPLEGEGCILRLPQNEEISIMQDEKERSEEKLTLTENVQQCATSHSTEALEAALKPLNFKRPKRKLLPASAIYFKDFNGLFMDENVMEAKRKKTTNVKARSDGSMSLIRIFKSNLPR